MDARRLRRGVDLAPCQRENRARPLRHGCSEIGDGVTGHRSTQHDFRRRRAEPAALGDELRDGRTDADLDVRPARDRAAGDGHDALDERLVIDDRVVDRGRGSDVDGDGANVDCGTAGRDLTTGDRAHELSFVSLWILHPQPHEPDVGLVRLRVKYPQGDERQLVRAVTGREIPSGGTAIDVGAVTVDVATASAVHDAVVYHQPLIERIVTVAGGAIARRANIKVRVGTPVSELIAECGGFSTTPAKVVLGGPMTGHTVADLATPVTKGTRAILALTRREVHPAPQTPCIHCGRCVEACPMGLNPMRLSKLIEYGELARAVEEGLFDCTECGACGYICPSRIPLVDGMRDGKAATGELARG